MISRPGGRVEFLNHRLLNSLLVLARPPIPTLCFQTHHTFAEQPFCRGLKMLRFPKQGLGITQVHCCDSPFAVFVDGLCDHGERVGSEVAASARFV